MTRSGGPVIVCWDAPVFINPSPEGWSGRNALPPSAQGVVMVEPSPTPDLVMGQRLWAMFGVAILLVAGMNAYASCGNLMLLKSAT